MHALRVDRLQHERELRTGDALPAHRRFAFDLRGGVEAAPELRGDLDLIPRLGRLREARLLDLDEERADERFVVRVVRHFEEKSAELRHRLDDERAREDRVVREVIVEDFVRERDVLYPASGLAGDDVGDTIEEEVAHDEAGSVSEARRSRKRHAPSSHRPVRRSRFAANQR